MEVLGRMAIGRVVTTAHVSARRADAQIEGRAALLAVYHLQQQELDRIQRQIDENNRIVDEMQRRLHVQST